MRPLRIAPTPYEPTPDVIDANHAIDRWVHAAGRLSLALDILNAPNVDAVLTAQQRIDLESIRENSTVNGLPVTLGRGH